MNFDKLKYVYFIGIGGIGMSALARYFKAMGCQVAGYDKTATTLTQQLINEGMQVQFDETVAALPPFINNAKTDELLIVYTPAIPKTHAGLMYLQNKFKIYKRAQVLGFITQNSKTIAVAGTHGKTTTSSIVAHLLVSNGCNCSAFLGGIATNYNTNFISGNAAKPNHVVVVEADEYDRSFLTLFPEVAIVTSMDADHLDIYSNHQTLIQCYHQFVQQVQSGGCIIIKSGLPITTTAAKQISYSTAQPAQAVADNIRIADGNYLFDYKFENVSISDLQLGLPGRHNIENAVAAITAVLQYQLNAMQIRNALQSYQGVKRRYEKIFANNKVQYIDDYAHHPEELRAAILSA
ncbi:MAG TPA: Mur ligase family protein, partial [Bacteroidia bacterium]|nr:Mur ligase family protein [Bacteroidia bacterium]